MAPSPPEVWPAAEAYEAYIGRWSRVVARRFIEWLSVPAESSWLAVGCGTGALVQTILDMTVPRQVVGIDLMARAWAVRGRKPGA